MGYEKVLIRFTPTQLAVLREYAKQHGTTTTMLIRMAVEKFINEPKLVEFRGKNELNG